MQHVEQRVLQSKKEVAELLEQCFEIRDKLSKEVQEKVKAAAFKLKSRLDLLKLLNTLEPKENLKSVDEKCNCRRCSV